ncbi:MAG: thiol:disulfide interchange protein DsbA/DsbL [Steroidobacteraceae bacterium]|nr:thiol:disulfide interchange protein DsbA/DsbL [Steroidobacteraceae bacterium]
MIRLPVALGLILLSISACARETAPPVAQPATDAAAAPPAGAAPAAPEAQTDESAQATASQESTTEANAEDKRDVTLERLAAMPSDQQLPAGKWKPGVNYTPLVPAQPTNVQAGKVEVVEVFWFGCPHCYALEPYISSWLKNKPEYIEFVKLPVMWGPVHRAHARLFYILETLNRRDLEPKVFDTIHNQRNMLAASDEQATRKMQQDWATANGISAADFNKAWDSFSVNSALQRAEQLTQRYRVEGVPMIVVNGKYKTDVGQAGGPSQLISLINDLAASERRR